MNFHLPNIFTTSVTRLRTESLYRFQLILILFLIAGSLYRIMYIIDYNPMIHIWSDPQRHWEQGVDVLRDDPMTLIDPVMYQLYISVFAKLTYRDYALTAYYTILLALLAPWAWYRRPRFRVCAGTRFRNRSMPWSNSFRNVMIRQD